MKLAISMVVLVLVAASCAGENVANEPTPPEATAPAALASASEIEPVAPTNPPATTTTIPTTTTTTTTQAPEPRTLEEAVVARAQAFADNEPVAMFDFYSERCGETAELASFVVGVRSWHQRQEDAGIKPGNLVITAEIFGAMATPSLHTEDGELVLEGDVAQWIPEDGEWRHDGC